MPADGSDVMDAVSSAGRCVMAHRATAVATRTKSPEHTTTATRTIRSRTVRTSVGFGTLEAEADPTDRGDVLRRRRVVAELSPQHRDVHVERLRRAEPGGVPDLAHQLLARDDLALLAHEHAQQV